MNSNSLTLLLFIVWMCFMIIDFQQKFTSIQTHTYIFSCVYFNIWTSLIHFECKRHLILNTQFFMRLGTKSCYFFIVSCTHKMKRSFEWKFPHTLKLLPCHRPWHWHSFNNFPLPIYFFIFVSILFSLCKQRKRKEKLFCNCFPPTTQLLNQCGAACYFFIFLKFKQKYLQKLIFFFSFIFIAVWYHTQTTINRNR
jgi:hypothetical protein